MIDSFTLTDGSLTKAILMDIAVEFGNLPLEVWISDHLMSFEWRVEIRDEDGQTLAGVQVSVRDVKQWPMHQIYKTVSRQLIAELWNWFDEEDFDEEDEDIWL